MYLIASKQIDKITQDNNYSEVDADAAYGIDTGLSKFYAWPIFGQHIWRANHKNSVPKLYLLLCTIMYIYNYVYYLV